MEPIFAQPGSVIPLPDRSAFIALLDEFNVPYHAWHKGEEKLAKYWKEVEEHDVAYTTTHGLISPHMPNMPVRFIITASAWVAIRRDTNTFVLTERKYNPENDSYELRRHNGSVSEKAKLDPSGAPTETFAHTIARCLAEETGTSVSEPEVAAGLHFTPWKTRSPLIGGAEHIEQDSKEKEEAPGIWHFNQIAHFFAYLPEHAFFDGWRRDAATQYLSRWGSANEDSWHQDPFPADLVIK